MVLCFLRLVLPVLLLAQTSEAAAEAFSTHSAIRYEHSVPSDPVARLAAQLTSGKRTLTWDADTGYLKSLLCALDIPASSQTLVFSKTSFQRDRITPKTPRALYFNDSVYVGFVEAGDVIELASHDPQNGATFYVLDQKPSSGAAAPRRVQEECLRCHESATTNEIPGFLLRSVFPSADGQPALAEGSFVITSETPFEQRWGGWYVTGTHGRARHMGNATLKASQKHETFDKESGANLVNVRSRFNATAYLRDTSDIVALMVMEHQTHVQNLITQANYHTRIALHDNRVMNEALGEPLYRVREATERRVVAAVEPLVRAMVMANEVTLSDPIAGTSGFSDDFARQGPFDRKGRSLRQLDLQRRVFAFPLSYLVYSPALDSLPPLASKRFWLRMCDVLNGRDRLGADIAAKTRTAVREILRDTKPSFRSCQ